MLTCIRNLISKMGRLTMCGKNKEKGCCCKCYCKCCSSCCYKHEPKKVNGVGVGDGFFVHHKDKKNSSYAGNIWLCTSLDDNVITAQCLTPGLVSMDHKPFMLSDYDVFKVSCSVIKLMKENAGII